jgi:NAD dependent epimerase/dehydratase family enzyme
MKASEANSQKTAIVIGATGIIGRAITEALAKDGKWNVIALSRPDASVPGADQAISVDLFDPESARRQPIASCRNNPSVLCSLPTTTYVSRRSGTQPCTIGERNRGS